MAETSLARDVRTPNTALNLLLGIDSDALDWLAQQEIESGRDWRAPARLTVRSPARRADRAQPAIPAPGPFCRVSDVFGYRFCFVCGGNDYQDTAFTCGEAR